LDDDFLSDLTMICRDLHSAGALKADSLAMAVLNFADSPDVTENQVLAEISTFFIAGMDTTAHTLSFFIYCLAKYPEVQQRCHEEVDKLLKSQSFESVSGKLPAYVEATLKESMRKFPVAAPGSFRHVNQPDGYQLTDNIHLPHGWWVVVNHLALHNYEGNWGSDVHEFKPERFLSSMASSSSLVDDGDPLETRQTTANRATSARVADNHNLTTSAAYGGAGYTAQDLCFAPFSFGVRNCLGMNLALMELRVTILLLLSKFEFELADKEMLNEAKMLTTSFTMQPRDGLPVKIRTRSTKA
jgi:cytochrome P450